MTTKEFVEWLRSPRVICVSDISPKLEEEISRMTVEELRQLEYLVSNKISEKLFGSG